MNIKICVVSGTHRQGSYTFRVSSYIHGILKNRADVSAELFSSDNFHGENLFDAGFGMQIGPLAETAERLIRPMDGFVWVVPEYNGSFPGILKAWIDAVHPSYFFGKTALLIGVSSGRAGNLRGLEHLTGIFQHLKMFVYPLKVPVSKIEEVWKNDIPDESIRQSLSDALEGFLKFTEIIRRMKEESQ